MIICNDKFTVYIHINNINGKMYAGITGQDPVARWKNGYGYKDCAKFYNAINKYGWDNFSHEIFAKNLTEEEAKNMEMLLIKELDLQNDLYGYNINAGGTDCSLAEETKCKIDNALRGRKYSDEKRKIYSEAHKGLKLSPEHVKAISEANRGRPRTEKELLAAKRNGNKMSGDNHWTRRLGIKQETKEKIANTLKDYYSEHEMHEATGKKKVQCIESGVTYSSIEEASKALNICRSQISEACVGVKRKTAGKCHWKFV